MKAPRETVLMGSGIDVDEIVEQTNEAEKHSNKSSSYPN